MLYVLCIVVYVYCIMISNICRNYLIMKYFKILLLSSPSNLTISLLDEVES